MNMQTCRCVPIKCVCVCVLYVCTVCVCVCDRNNLCDSHSQVCHCSIDSREHSPNKLLFTSWAHIHGPQISGFPLSIWVCVRMCVCARVYVCALACVHTHVCVPGYPSLLPLLSLSSGSPPTLLLARSLSFSLALTHTGTHTQAHARTHSPSQLCSALSIIVSGCAFKREERALHLPLRFGRGTSLSLFSTSSVHPGVCVCVRSAW